MGDYITNGQKHKYWTVAEKDISFKMKYIFLKSTRKMKKNGHCYFEFTRSSKEEMKTKPSALDAKEKF